MKFVNKIVLITLLVFFLSVIMFIIVQKTRNPVCESPLILFIQSNNNRPEIIIDRIISELGGLPKTDMEIHKGQKSVGDNQTPPIYPVDEWIVKSSSVINSNFNTLFDDDPIYSYDIVIHVTYTDGDTSVLEWSSWSYGIVACPILISMGSGPPGRLKVLP